MAAQFPMHPGRVVPARCVVEAAIEPGAVGLARIHTAASCSDVGLGAAKVAIGTCKRVPWTRLQHKHGRRAANVFEGVPRDEVVGIARRRRSLLRVEMTWSFCVLWSPTAGRNTF